MKRTARHATGSVVYDRRRKTWNLYFYEDGKRRSRLIGTRSDYPTKSAACRAAGALNNPTKINPSATAPTVVTLVEQYRVEKMPLRFSTRCGYNSWLNNHVIPKWGAFAITELEARPVELWLQALALEPKSKVAIRGLIHNLWDFSMWRDDIPRQRNPMELVTIRGATKRGRKPRSLTVDEFRRFILELEEPFSHDGARVRLFRPTHQRMSGVALGGCRLAQWQTPR